MRPCIVWKTNNGYTKETVQPCGWDACLEMWSSRNEDSFWPLIEFVPGSPWFILLSTLVNSQLVCLQPVGILNSCCVLLFCSLCFIDPEKPIWAGFEPGLLPQETICPSGSEHERIVFFDKALINDFYSVILAMIIIIWKCKIPYF